jgi:glycosyltransferase involved in cell wall biosynthesis
MKLLINAISARFGGIVTYTTNLVRSLRSRQVDVTFAVSRQFPMPDERDLIRVKASEFGALHRLLWEQTRWRGIVARSDADVLFSSANFALLNSPKPQVLLLREGGLFDPKYLVHVAPSQGLKAAALRQLRRLTMLESARRADHLITPTAAMRDLLLYWAPDLRQKISVINYGTLVDVFRPESRSRSWREDGTLRLLYVSVYYPHKNPGTICRAIEILAEREVPAHATITMNMDELRMRGGALDALLVEKAAQKSLVSLGRLPYPALPGTYRTHDVFVFPSVSETFGHPMVEAMSSGIPVVAADTAVNREICGDAALYFSPFSATELSDHLQRLDADPALRNELTRRGRERAVGRFTWDHHVDGLLEVFDLVHSRRRRSAI